jgi:hypothetical protein
LGIGAVVPFLHATCGDAGVTLIQRYGEWAEDLKEGDSLAYENDAGFRRIYRVHLMQSAEGFERFYKAAIAEHVRDHLVILVGDSVAEVLHVVNDPETMVTCSLGENQGALFEPLRASRGLWSRLLLFENLVNWPAFAGLAQFGAVSQVVVDRICWDISTKTKAERGGVLTRRVSCEKSFASFWVPEGLAMSQPSRGKESGFAQGECLVDEYRTKDQLGEILKRKRALVNAIHAVLGMLCFYALAKRDMRANEQYLATAEALLKREQPEACQALDVYMRLRAAEIAWDECDCQVAEAWQAKFATYYETAKRSMERFLATADRLGRVFGGVAVRADGRRIFSKDFAKLSEHVDRPLDSFSRIKDRLWAGWRLGRPSEEDVYSLKAPLMKAFEAMIHAN